nr:hypothetical protein [Tanacetum cinerariifolium]
GSSFGLTAFSDVDHVGCIDSRKSTSGGIQFLEEQGDAEEQGNADNTAEEPVTAASEDDVEDQSIPSPTLPTPPPQ